MTTKEYIQKFAPSWIGFFDKYEDEFEKAPAGKTIHHNFDNGLSVHTAEVIRACFEIRDSVSRVSLAANPDALSLNKDEFADEDIVVAAFLHDFAKIRQYKKNELGDWVFVQMTMPQEVWTLMTLAQEGQAVSETVTLALLNVEGGFSEFKDSSRPNSLAWLLSMGDIWSSQIICPTLPKPECPRCGKPLMKRNGARGWFWGCSGYPACNFTENIAS